MTFLKRHVVRRDETKTEGSSNGPTNRINEEFHAAFHYRENGGNDPCQAEEISTRFEKILNVKSWKQ